MPLAETLLATLPAAEVPARVVERRIMHLRDACAFINDTITTHRDADVFQTIVDWAVRSCEIEPVELAKAFEVSTGTVSRWRSGKNAPHPRERPRVIAWIKERMGARIDELERELTPPDFDQAEAKRRARL